VTEELVIIGFQELGTSRLVSCQQFLAQLHKNACKIKQIVENGIGKMWLLSTRLYNILQEALFYILYSINPTRQLTAAY